MNSFTRAVLRSMLAEEAETIETVRQWVKAEQDPARRLEQFARQLEHDLCEQYCVEEVRQQADQAGLLLEAAILQVEFRQLARALLKRFGPRPAWWSPAAAPSAN
jgi:hypothetical protein